MARLELSLRCQPRGCVSISSFYLLFWILKPQEVIIQQLIHFPQTSTCPEINWLEISALEIYHFHFCCPFSHLPRV